MFYKNFIFLSIITLLSGCGSSFHQREYCGADEFVLDSYRISEGALSIQKMQGRVVEELSPELLEEYPDTIKEGDVLYLSIYLPRQGIFAPNIQNISERMGFFVKEKGVFIPDIGTVFLKGLTLSQAQEKLQKECFSEMGKIEVSLSFKHKAKRNVEIGGMAYIPSVQADGKTTLYDALCLARIPPEANLFHSYIKRDFAVLPIDFHKLLKEGDMSHNIVLREGDKIYIADPSSSSVMVLGEVGHERKVFLPSGKLPIKEALAEARGIPFTGDKSFIQVIRGGVCKPKIYLLNWEQIIRLPNSSALLMPGDMVLVRSRPITQWSRFVSQLMPSMTDVEMIYKRTKSVGVLVK